MLPAVGSMMVAPGLQTFFFGVENHAQRRAIFHRSAGVHPFELRVNVSEGWLCKSTGEGVESGL